MLVFNQRNTTAMMSKGELEFIEEIFNVDSTREVKESGSMMFNVVLVNAGNGDGCNEVHNWIQEVSGVKKGVKEIEAPKGGKKTGCFCFR